MGGVGLSPTRSSPNFGPGRSNSPIWFMPPGIGSSAADFGQWSEKMQVQPTGDRTSPELSVLVSQGGAHPGDSGSGDAARRIVVQAACLYAASCSKPLQTHPQLVDEWSAKNHFSSFQEPDFVLQSD